MKFWRIVSKLDGHCMGKCGRFPGVKNTKIENKTPGIEWWGIGLQIMHCQIMPQKQRQTTFKHIYHVYLYVC